MRRVTADSNILISALRYDGKPLTLLELALDGRFELFISDEILEETLGVLRDKFKRAPEELSGDRAYIEACTVRVVPTERLHVVPDDEDDNRVLECAVAGECECVVTGDGDLLRMGSYEGIRILRVGEFLERLKETD